MIKVTFEFKSVDEAIVFLGKQVSAAPRVLETPTATPPRTAPAAAEPVRKGRSDKGKPRGRIVRDAAPPAAPVVKSATTVVKSATVVGTSVDVPTKDTFDFLETNTTGEGRSLGAKLGAGAGNGTLPAVPDTSKSGEQPINSISTPAVPLLIPVVPTQEQVQAALENLFTAKNLQAAQSVLMGFGVQRIRDLKQEDRAAFIAKANSEAAK